MRPSFDQIYMGLARALALRSTCARLKVGCVITSEDYRYVYGIGYNGNAVGEANGCSSTQPGSCGHLHAEENAIINCADHTARKRVYITNSPCVMCAKRLINLRNVSQVIFGTYYRSDEGLELLNRHCIPTLQYLHTPSATVQL